MDVLTTRLLTYLDEAGRANDLVLTIFAPWDAGDVWKCGFAFPDADRQRRVEICGVDYIQALLLCLEIVPQYLRLARLPSRARWHGMPHCGLPSHAERPPDFQPPEIGPAEANPGGMDVLTTRTLGHPDQHGAARPFALTVYKPLQTREGEWKCAVSLGPSEEERLPVRYGVGADFIESLLDALRLARATYEALMPRGWHAKSARDWLDCADFPFKVGRAFHTDMVGDLGPGAPDFAPS